MSGTAQVELTVASSAMQEPNAHLEVICEDALSLLELRCRKGEPRILILPHFLQLAAISY